jgi:hypothetical protein
LNEKVSLVFLWFSLPMAQSPPVTVIVLVFVGVIVTAIVLIVLFAFACRFVRDSENVQSVSNLAHFGVPSASIRRLKGLSKEEIERACPLVIYRGPHNFVVDVDQSEELNGETDASNSSTLKVPSMTVQDAVPWGTNVEEETVVANNPEESDSGESRKIYGYGKYRVPEGICAVCLEEVTIGTYLRMLHCRHAFHDGCITHWLLCANRCPLCNCPAYEIPVEATRQEEPQAIEGTRVDSVVVNLAESRQEGEEGTRSISVTDQELLASLRRQSTRPTTRAQRFWAFLRFGPYATAS